MEQWQQQQLIPALEAELSGLLPVLVRPLLLVPSEQCDCKGRATGQNADTQALASVCPL
jgi:hypothetical protein